ncbi:hypothetical protein KDL01_04365 [Actinospica durhamensis]|uniref:DUF4760 domain-containing protein n=1 Tax=Actinospica durhamensis TaxID=1508375 RepID=A0A941EL14_9ACTN|nr:hypothetical protein [Actinospica durhamensis]MBR7832477.1 hypothetical protein [Actinospica durhamensis]
MDWTSVAIPLGSTIVGTLVGAYATYRGTDTAQKKELAAARQARVDANQDAAIAALTASFADILRHVRAIPRPSADTRHQGDIEAAWKDEREKELWSGKLWDIVGPSAMAARTLRDERVRLALLEVFNLLEDWELLFYTYSAYGAPWFVLHAIAEHGVLTLTAFQREERLPAPGEVYRDAKDSFDHVSKLVEARWAEEEAAQAAASGSAPPGAP